MLLDKQKPDLQQACDDEPKQIVPISLPYLDGLRGLAALYVVMCHAYLEIFPKNYAEGLTQWQANMTNWIRFGHISVAIFIVLSGYCLMLPNTQNVEVDRQFSILKFFQRRARRILPPYYAALVLSLLLIAVIPSLQKPTFPRNWNLSLPAFDLSAILAHVFLFQNWSAGWQFKIDGPMWSVATEWQIYFLFPLLLLPVWRKYGILVTILTAFLVGIGVDHFFPTVYLHYLGLFAFGMAGAVINFRSASINRFPLHNKLWLILAIVLSCVFVFLSHGDVLWMGRHATQADSIVGLAILGLLAYSTNCIKDHPQKRPLLIRFLETRPVKALGSFSYSLYLVHFPVLAIAHLLIRHCELSSPMNLMLMLGGGIPLSLGIAYLFFLVFERPFLNTKKPPVLTGSNRAATVSIT